MLAVLGGLGAALSFTATTICAARASRLIGPPSVLAWVAVVGFVVCAPVAAVQRPLPTSPQVVWLAVAGVGNVAGLLLVYSALGTGKVGVVAPITSTEGAIAALIAVLAGERLAGAAILALAVIAVGVVLAARPHEDERPGPGKAAEGALLACGAALCFGMALYATGRISSLPVGWAVIPPRIVGVAAITVPLAASGRLRISRAALPFVVAGGLCEVLGFASYTFGARHGIAVSAVIASLFAALAAVAAYLLFAERLGRLQRVGVGTIAVGVALLSALHP